MTEKPIGRFPVPELPDMPEDIRARIVGVQEKAGFVLAPYDEAIGRLMQIPGADWVIAGTIIAEPAWKLVNGASGPPYFSSNPRASRTRPHAPCRASPG